MDMQLSTFELRFDDSTRVVTAEVGALGGIAATLKVLQIQNCLNDDLVIHNLTG